MDRVEISKELDLSRIVYGMWRLADDIDTSEQHVIRKIETCLDQGITSFDQADIYGGYTAEAVLGLALKQTPALRHKLEIVTKCDIIAPVGRYESARIKHYDTSRDHIIASVEASLMEMSIDHIDMLLIHRPDPLMDHYETGSALDEVVASGKVRSVGVSNFRPWDWQLLQSGMTTPLATNQIELSLDHIEPFTDGDLAFHQQHNHPIMAWSPLGGGSLMAEGSQTGRIADSIAQAQGVDRAAVLVAFLLRHPARILPVMGTNNLDRIAAIGDAANVELSREQWFELYTAALGAEVA